MKNLGIQSGALFIANARKVFTKFKQAFVEVLIFNYFDLKCHIQIEMNILSYIISKILSQQISDDLGQ